MSEQEVFVLSEQALKVVIDRIEDDQWELDAEELSPGKNITLRKLITYHTYDSLWVPETLAGKTIQEVGAKYDGDLLGDKP